MYEKGYLEDYPSSAFRPRTSHDDEPIQPRWHSSYSLHRDRTLRRLCLAICLLLGILTVTRSLLPYLSSSHHSDAQRIIGDELPKISIGNNTRRVSLEAHIMSKCPDAKACLQELVVPVMEKVSDKVEFELSFIGR